MQSKEAAKIIFTFAPSRGRALVHIADNDMASFNVGADATSQHQMIEINFDHCLLTFKRRKALCCFVNNRGLTEINWRCLAVSPLKKDVSETVRGLIEVKGCRNVL